LLLENAHRIINNKKAYLYDITVTNLYWKDDDENQLE